MTQAPQIVRSEARVVADVLIAVSALPGCMVWRNNTGVGQAGNRVVRFSVPGAPDILGAFRGRALGIECKRPGGGRQSPEQLRFQRAFEAAGGLYLLVRSADEALQALEGTA